MSIILKTKTTKVEYAIPKEDWDIQRLCSHIDIVKREIENLSNYLSKFKCSTDDKVKLSKSLLSLYMALNYTEKRIVELGGEV
ncbi:MAG: hypothetical protein ACRDBY_12995 [Cetobacterium sp.]